MKKTGYTVGGSGGNIKSFGKELPDGTKRRFELNENNQWAFYTINKDGKRTQGVSEYQVAEYGKSPNNRLSNQTDSFFNAHHPLKNATMKKLFNDLGYAKEDAPVILLRDGFRTDETPHGLTWQNQNKRTAKNFEEEWEHMKKDMAEVGVPEAEKAQLKKQLVLYYKGIYKRTPVYRREKVWGNWRPENAEL